MSSERKKQGETFQCDLDNGTWTWKDNTLQVEGKLEYGKNTNGLTCLIGTTREPYVINNNDEVVATSNQAVTTDELSNLNYTPASQVQVGLLGGDGSCCVITDNGTRQWSRCDIQSPPWPLC